MKLPDGAVEMEIIFDTNASKEYGEVKISFGGGFGEKWSVWDSRTVRQGSRFVSDGHSYKAACEVACKLAKSPKGWRG